jgi:uncharacterized protein YoxC
MERRINIAPVTRPAPPALDVEALSTAINNIVYQFNLLADDVKRYQNQQQELSMSVGNMQHTLRTHNEALSDLEQLVEFLEQNPGADLKDWVKYEAVKERMSKAASRYVG